MKKFVLFILLFTTAVVYDSGIQIYQRIPCDGMYYRVSKDGNTWSEWFKYEDKFNEDMHFLFDVDPGEFFEYYKYIQFKREYGLIN